MAEPESPQSHESLYRLYRVLLAKYADLINEKEKRTIGEVKALINAADMTIQSLIGRFKKDGYVFSFVNVVKRQILPIRDRFLYKIKNIIGAFKSSSLSLVEEEAIFCFSTNSEFSTR